MDAALQSIVASIHASPTRAVVYAAGGASQALGWLLSVPRASETILEASIPYSRISMIQLLGKTPNKYASKETAESMACVALNRSLNLSIPGTPVAGIGFTGSLVSATPKRGAHRCHVCARTCNQVWNYELTLIKGLRDRMQEDSLASRILIKALAITSGVGDNFPINLEGSEKILETSETFTEDEQIRQLIMGTINMVPLVYGSNPPQDQDARRVILPGSFNPLHEGHLKLMDAACRIIPGVPVFEISVINADKPPLSVDEIKSRASQFRIEGKTLVLTNQPYFFKKAELFPNSTFVIGADTAIRLVNPKYYDGSYSRMVEVLHGIQQLGCDFLVAGRKIEYRYVVLSEITVPLELNGIFKTLPTEDFRVDISSTEIRKKYKQGLCTS